MKKPLRHSFSFYFLCFNPLRTACIAFVLCTNVFAKIVDPSEQYRFLDTPHFRIVFNAQQQALAMHYSVQLEKAYAFLAERFSERPDQITVIINDNTDASNGYATPIPYPHIMLYPVLPMLQEPLGEPSSWALELTTHEFTHILSFYPTNGFMYALKKILGTVVAPNALMPLWWLEGVAVYNESTVSQGGRLRSTYQDTVLRAMQIDRTLENFKLAEINEILPSYPSSRPYLFGSILWSEMIAQKGVASVDELTQRQAGRVPYFLNAPAEDKFGMNYENLFHRGLERLTKKYDEQIQTLQTVPPSNTSALPWNQSISYQNPKIIATQSPAISSDGQFLAVVSTDEYLRKNLKIYKRGKQGFLDMKSWAEDGTDPVIDLPDKIIPSSQVGSSPMAENDEHANLPSGSIQRVSWFPGKHQIVFDKISQTSSFQFFSDLYTFDLETQETKQLTEKQRLREPAVAPNGQTIAYISVMDGKTKVCLMDLTNNQEHCLVESNFDEIYSWPTFLQTNSLIVTQRNPAGYDQLIQITWEASSFKTTSVRPMLINSLTKNTLLRFPFVFENKIYLVANLNGAPNIYLYNDKHALQPVSHLLTGSLSFTQDPVTLQFYLTQITSKGLQITQLEKHTVAASLPQITPVFLQTTQAAQTQVALSPKTATDDQAVSVAEYSPWSYLIPRYWVPFLSSSSQHSGMLVSAQTGSMDPLQYHQYSLFGLYDTYLKRGSGNFNYLNQTTPVGIGMAASQTNSYLVTSSEQVTNDYASLNLIPDLFSIHKSLGLHTGVFYQNKMAFNENFKKQGGFIQIAYVDVSKSLSQVTPNTGDLYSIGYQASQDQTKKVDLSQWTFDLTHFESHFLPRFHGLKLRAAGLVTTTTVPSLYGESSTNYEQPGTIFLMRGYPNGLFTGRTFLNGQLEYRLPLFTLNRGAGTTPLFIKRTHLAFIADTGRLDGFYYNQNTETYESVNTSRAFWNAGVEFKVDITLGYHLPIQIVIGGYRAFENKIVNNANTLAIQLRGLSL